MESEPMDLDVEMKDFSINAEHTSTLLTRNDIELVFKNMLFDKSEFDCTVVCFQIFHSIMACDIVTKDSRQDYHKLDIFIKYIDILKSCDRFNPKKFLSFLNYRYNNVPLEIIWWLNKWNIVSFHLYWKITNPGDLARFLQQLIHHKKNPKLIEDLLTELFRGCYRPNLGVCRLQKSKSFVGYCSQVLDNLIHDTLESILTDKTDLYEHYVPFIQYTSKSMPLTIVRHFCKAVLDVLLLTKAENVGMFEAYTYQQLWNTEKMDKKLECIYGEIFSHFCTAKDILHFLDEKKYINWKYALYTISACVKYSPTGPEDIQGIATKTIKSSFVGGRIKKFVAGLLFMRQCCSEPNTQTYRSWFASSFGPHGSFQISNNATNFKFLMSTLAMLIPYEPQQYLQIHIDQGLSAPPRFNYLIHDFKNLCRSRMTELKQSPSITMNDVKIKVLHLCEETSRNECISTILVHIIKYQHNDYFRIFIPQVLRNQMPFTKVHDMLKQGGYLNNNFIETATIDTHHTVFDIDGEDDDFQ